MRRLIPLALLLSLALAACGSSSGSSPLKAELSYFPSGSAFVMSVATEPSGDAIRHSEALLHRFPLASLGETALIAKLAQLGVDYQSDLRPLFGNPLLFGLASSSFAGARQQFLAVWETKDATKLSELVNRLLASHAVGSHGAAKLYSMGATTLAVTGATVVLGGSEPVVTAALDRHANGAGFSNAAYTSETAGLPSTPLVEIFGSLANVLATPSTATARRVPWVAALRGYSAAINATASGLSFRFHLDTSGGTLTPDQLPFAAGATPPNLAGSAPITAGAFNPSQIVAFAESVEQATNPAAYARFLRRQAAVRARTGTDLDALAGLLTDNLIISSDTHLTMGRAAVRNATTAATTLGKLMTAPKSVFTAATHVTRLPGGFYAVHEKKQTIVVGVTGGDIVAGNASVAQLRAFAAAPGAPAAGAQGTFAFRLALPTLLHLAIKTLPSPVVQGVLASLGDITGWASASPSGVTGSATLAVR